MATKAEYMESVAKVDTSLGMLLIIMAVYKDKSLKKLEAAEVAYEIRKQGEKRMGVEAQDANLPHIRFIDGIVEATTQEDLDTVEAELRARPNFTEEKNEANLALVKEKREALANG